MNLSKNTTELVSAGIITEDTAQKIEAYYKEKKRDYSSLKRVIPAILGAICVSLGLIAIMAHNWDDLPKMFKLTVAFVPLVLSQAACFFTLSKKMQSVVWRETSSVFLFFSIGLVIALVAQIYHIPGTKGTFWLTWMLLALPVVYLVRSSVTACLYMLGIIYSLFEVNYSGYNSSSNYTYWLLLLGNIPYYYLLYRKNNQSNVIAWFHWLFVGSVLIALPSLIAHYDYKYEDEFGTMLYIATLGLFTTLGNISWLQSRHIFCNPYKILGTLGLLGIILVMSFNDVWNDFKPPPSNELYLFSAFYIVLLLLFTSLVFTYVQMTKRKQFDTTPWIAILFLSILFFKPAESESFEYTVSLLVVNLILLAWGVLKIREGYLQNKIGTLNWGLLLISATILVRFFDSDINFIVKGISFITVGVGFFFANYMMITKNKQNEQ